MSQNQTPSTEIEKPKQDQSVIDVVTEDMLDNVTGGEKHNKLGGEWMKSSD